MSDQYSNELNSATITSASSFPAEEPAQPKFDREQLIFLQESQKHTKHAVDGARWFYWLAGLSIVNSVIAVFEGDISFMFGLGITQVIDYLTYSIALDVGTETGMIVKIIGLILSIFIASFGFVIGYIGLKGKKWILNVGVGLYILDLLICLYFGLYLDAFFHVIVMFFLIRGVRAFSKLNQLTKKPVSQPAIPLHQ